MARTFKIQITETTPGCILSHPMTIEAPADSVSALIQYLAALPLDGVKLVPLPRAAKTEEHAADHRRARARA
jgi:hypothetical protein